MQLALGLMCQPTQNGAFQPYQSMAMVFRYRQSQDNDACQGRHVEFYRAIRLASHPHHTPRSLWPRSIGMAASHVAPIARLPARCCALLHFAERCG